MQHKLTLSDEDLAVIQECFMLGPHGKVMPLIQKINAQIQANREKDAEANPQVPTYGK